MIRDLTNPSIILDLLEDYASDIEFVCRHAEMSTELKSDLTHLVSHMRRNVERGRKANANH